MAFSIEPLSKRHDRSGFCCGVDALDTYLRNHVGQDQRRFIASCFVAIDQETGKVVGYYTLAPAEVSLADLPEELAGKLPRYPRIGAARLGRLAVDISFQKKKLGAALLADALKRVADSEIKSFAVLVDAKDENAASFYKHHGFISLKNSPLILFLPMATIMAAG